MEQVRTVAVTLNTGLLLRSLAGTTDGNGGPTGNGLQAHSVAACSAIVRPKARANYYEVSGQCFLYYHGTAASRAVFTYPDTSRVLRRAQSAGGCKSPSVMDIVIIKIPVYHTHTYDVFF